MTAPDEAATASTVGPVPTRSAALGLAARRAFGGLLSLLDDPEVRDILVHTRAGAGELWLDRGARLERVTGWEASAEAVRGLATALIAAGGRHLDELQPCADVRLGDGIRVHAVLPPVSVAGAAVSIRVPGIFAPDFSQLVRRGLCSEPTAWRLAQLVETRRNFLVTGGTASGKTTLLTALLGRCDPGERIVTIEDVAEIRLQHDHVIALEARPMSAEGVGEVTVERLLREALRMRPDRIVLGECRGAEIVTLLTALNTGHDGGAGTLHASSLADVPARLEALGSLAGLDPGALGRQAASALHAIVQVERGPLGHRISAIGELRLGAGGVLEVTEVQ
ncbi:pilus assembly protein CpaF [Leucobacter exalbidus]|uniref:Pilus assembly protein CpaF n=1 Tax=Leucobacter exalbidus TaxID=662960 RepID=A0A940PUE6_9MICO|nr:ATPase, T2SS/T4P/T4SS family [Leucobacter exalbidus]MBP1327013.1 pilus assembly protein CpaF [Leucobacter exalbidus]